MPSEFQLNHAAHLLEVMSKMIRDNDSEEYRKLMAAPEWQRNYMADNLQESADQLRDKESSSK